MQRGSAVVAGAGLATAASSSKGAAVGHASAIGPGSPLSPLVSVSSTPLAPGGRYIIFGDAHGCVDELRELLDKCEVGPADVLISVGDLVAKGPDSAGVIDLCRQRGVVSVMGNHDSCVLDFVDGGSLFKSSEHKHLASSLSTANIEYLRRMPLAHRIPALNVIVVHAGLIPAGEPAESLAMSSPDVLRNLRRIEAGGKPSFSTKPAAGTLWAQLWTGPELVVFGHDATSGLQDHPLAIGLDTGCCYGNALTAVILPERRFVSVKAHRAYAPTSA